MNYNNLIRDQQLAGIMPSQQPVQQQVEQPSQPSIQERLYTNVASQEPQQVQPVGRQINMRDQLAQNLAESQNVVAENQKRLGITAPGFAPQFKEKAIKIGNTIIARKELDDLNKLQDQAIRRYAQESGFTDQASVSHITNIKAKELNAFKLNLIKRALEFEAQMRANGMNQAQMQQAAANFGAVAGTGAAILLAAPGGPGAVAVAAPAGGEAGSNIATNLL